MKQGLKNSFNKNYLWVTIAGTNSVAHDSDINLFVYFPYNLLFMAGKDLLFCHKKMLLVFWVISHSVISIKMISINFTAKPDWLTDLLTDWLNRCTETTRVPTLISGSSENWEAEYSGDY